MPRLVLSFECERDNGLLLVFTIGQRPSFAEAIHHLRDCEGFIQRHFRRFFAPFEIILLDGFRLKLKPGGGIRLIEHFVIGRCTRNHLICGREFHAARVPPTIAKQHSAFDAADEHAVLELDADGV